VEEVLLLLWIFRFLLLDVHGGNDGIGLCIDNILPFVIPLVEF